MENGIFVRLPEVVQEESLIGRWQQIWSIIRTGNPVVPMQAPKEVPILGLPEAEKIFDSLPEQVRCGGQLASIAIVKTAEFFGASVVIGAEVGSEVSKIHEAIKATESERDKSVAKLDLDIERLRKEIALAQEKQAAITRAAEDAISGKQKHVEKALAVAKFFTIK